MSSERLSMLMQPVNLASQLQLSAKDTPENCSTDLMSYHLVVRERHAGLTRPNRFEYFALSAQLSSSLLHQPEPS
jgi:hypothetical protein